METLPPKPSAEPGEPTTSAATAAAATAAATTTAAATVTAAKKCDSVIDDASDSDNEDFVNNARQLASGLAGWLDALGVCQAPRKLGSPLPPAFSFAHQKCTSSTREYLQENICRSLRTSQHTMYSRRLHEALDCVETMVME